jgi:hypothetical protein
MWNRHLLMRLTLVFSITFLLATFSADSFGQDPSGRPTPKNPGKKPPAKKPPVKVEPEPITVILTVLTNPPESEVFINGQRRGVSNSEGRIQFEKLPLARYSVEVRKEGYAPAVRGFQAGAESPTLVFKLEPVLDRYVKEFDALISAGKLAGPQTPNALEMVEKLSKQFPDQPEVVRMRGVLAARFAEAAAPTIVNTITSWRTITREEIVRAMDSNTNALLLKSDDRRLEAEAAYFKGALALRDWFAYGAQSQSSDAPVGGGLAGARAEFEKAIGLEDAWAAPRYQLGVAQIFSGDNAGAEAAFIKVVQLEPKWASAHCYLGQAYHAGGKYKEAVDAFRRALEIDPSFAAAHAGLGLARASKGERDAVKDIERAMQLDPSSGLPNFNLGLLLSQSRRTQDRARAVEEFKKAIQKNPMNFDFLNSRAEKMIADLQQKKR